ncbi:MAG: diaminopimelate epimerase, partial [Magnetococcales bacterium]|nr:diaminopimelate epimerase [Magnetococcales bacterium]
GSEAEMSGNGIRCASRVCFEGSFRGRTPLDFVTPGGRFRTENFVDPESGVACVRVFTGRIETNPERVLADGSREPFIDRRLEGEGLDGWGLTGTILSIGNPHLVVTVPDLAKIDLPFLGNALEHHPMFRNRANVSFVQVVDPRTILVQTHERGVGPTLSCGTGMTASTVAQVLSGGVQNGVEITVHTAGGIAWVTPAVTPAEISARLMGNATLVYRGTVGVVVAGGEVRLAPGEPIRRGEVFQEEARCYERLAARSLFDRSVLRGTALAAGAMSDRHS